MNMPPGETQWSRSEVTIYLVCDWTKIKTDEAVFKRISSISYEKHLLYLIFALSHRCCCPDGCLPTKSYTATRQQLDEYPDITWITTTLNSDQMSGRAVNPGLLSLSTYASRPARHLWYVIACIGIILAISIFIASTCRKRGGGFVTGGPYAYLPALHHSSRMTLASIPRGPDSRYASSVLASADYREYSTTLVQSSRLPMLDYCVISSDSVDIGQRLGGGLFVDTYLAQWKNRRVAAKRLILGTHRWSVDQGTTQGGVQSRQPTFADQQQYCEWVVSEVTRLSKQRHGSLASVLGVCTDTRQPHVITEYIDGESLRVVIRRGNISADPDEAASVISLLHCIKLCSQVADGMLYLHSSFILHRDLRCANILLDRTRRKAKIVDYGLTRIIQRQRQDCCRGSNCYCHPDYSAFPASIRWTAPEILANPQADELTSGDVYSTASDVYSFAMVLWEVASITDPFDDVKDESQVIELVLSDHRPALSLLHGVIPHYRKLVQQCWDQHPDNRPSFHQVLIQLKGIAAVMSKMTQRRDDIRTDSIRDSTTASYLRSALNISMPRSNETKLKAVNAECE